MQKTVVRNIYMESKIPFFLLFFYDSACNSLIFLGVFVWM